MTPGKAGTGRPVVHLICNAHLDPVWQWRWDEGAAEAIATFGVAARLLREFPDFVFNHNEAILYRWVREYDAPLFREIQRLAAEGRWCISGGWDLQPDVNMPGTESIVRHIAEGRRFFQEHFAARPVVAYNFDSFGHSGGLPQMLVRAGYRMYVHLRPGEKDLPLPADLYRWRGIDGSEVVSYRIPFSAYNTFHNMAVDRINEGVELALRLNRDTPVFWGLGDHGGGATKLELEQIAELMKRETRVTIIHSSTEGYYRAICDLVPSLPVHEGDLQRVFTGCYTSMSRLKRRMQRNLAELVQTEGLRAAAWWLEGLDYPDDALQGAWQDHLFNDFHDILPGSSVEIAEFDALDLYGRSSETSRRLRLGALSGLSRGSHLPADIPVAVLNMNPGRRHVPVEVEYMIDHVPKWKGTWHARLFAPDGAPVTVQEEPAESLLLRDEWRRRLCFNAALPHIGLARYRIEMHEGPPPAAAAPTMAHFGCSRDSGLVNRLDAGGGREVLTGEAMKGLLVEDLADSWGMEEWSYRNVLGTFATVPGSVADIVHGPVRSVSECVATCAGSRIIYRIIGFAGFPFLEFRLRIHWNEERKRLKLSIPTVFRSADAFCDIPGGAIRRPADGQEHVHGRWMMLAGTVGGKETALAVINSGQHGFDLHNGEIRLSILRSPLYCHERTYTPLPSQQKKYMDQGVHEVRLLMMAGDAGEIRESVAGLADWLNAPPYVLSHYPIGADSAPMQDLASIEPGTIRCTACKRSWDGTSLIIRLQETAGRATPGTVSLHEPPLRAEIHFGPYEIKTIRFERDGRWNEVTMIEEERL